MMDRQRRSSQENHLWGNPCDYGSDNKSLKYTAKLAKEVEIQARNALNAASEYKDKFVKLHSFSTYEDLLSTWSGTDWIKSFSWLNQEVKDGLPKQNLQYKQVTQAYVDNLMKNIDSHLPSMFRGLKMVVAGLYLVSTEGLNDDIRSDAELKQNITKTMHNARAVLCLFNDVLRSRGLEIAPLPDSDLPDFKNDKVLYAFLVYRDTLNYLEYLSDVFKHMHMVDLKKTD